MKAGRRAHAPRLVAEVIGTFALIFMGAGAIIMTDGENLVAIGLAHGLAIALMVAAAGHISGGVYNPAVALGLAIAGKLRPDKAVAYIVAELVGATLAALALTAVFPSELRDAVGLGTPRSARRSRGATRSSPRSSRPSS